MARSFQIVEYKVAETDFFLAKLDDCSNASMFFEARNYLSAFLSASRSITFVIKASMHDLKGFDEWYSLHEAKLKASPIAKYFLESRNLSQKVGFYPLTGASSAKDKNGKKRTVYYFAPSIEKANVEVPDTDVYSACLEYFKMLLEVVYDCYQAFGYDIDPDRYYTVDNLKRLNLSVEDIEEELGFPKGWTGMGGGTIEERMNAIRQSQSSPGVDHILLNRIGKDRFGNK